MDSEARLYIRVRGRVLGPYDQERLQQMVRRGQLSRMHEISTDGTHWVRAATYSELFVGEPVKLPEAARRAAAGRPGARPGPRGGHAALGHAAAGIVGACRVAAALVL